MYLKDIHLFNYFLEDDMMAYENQYGVFISRTEMEEYEIEHRDD